MGHLEDEALKRKERLKALKRGELKTLNDQNNSEEADDLLPKPLFRNYTPKDEVLKSNILPRPDLTEIRNEIKEQLESGKPKPLIEKEIDLATLAPQKIDWDLKREAEKRLKLLDKRTQKAIVELIRDRLKSQTNADLAEMVSLGSRVNARKNQDNSQGEEEESEESEDEPDEQLQKYSESRENQEPTESDKKMFVYEQHEISDDDEF